MCQKMVKQLKWAKLAWACAAYSMPATGPQRLHDSLMSR